MKGCSLSGENTKDSLLLIIWELKNQNFLIKDYCSMRMDERGIRFFDLLAVIKKNYGPIWNSKNRSWNFTGKSLDGELLTLACKYNKGTVIVTVFKE